ncbi:MAG: hypothetical protein RR285_05745 [Acinetobacter sp.]
MKKLDLKLAELACEFKEVDPIGTALATVTLCGCDGCDGGCRGGGFWD